jgi:hypothetical protein
MHMKKILVLVLAIVLTACAAPTPAPVVQPSTAPPEATTTPVVVVETVVVVVTDTQIATEVPPPTAVPPTAIPPTAVPESQAVAPTVGVVNTSASNGEIIVDNVLGAGWFVNMTRSADAFALRCQLSKEITFSVTPTDANITAVEFYYRTQDRATGAVFDWQNAGRMIADANGNFKLVFSGESVNANFRKPNAWFDYQFVGLSRSGGVVGRSEGIEQQVSYTFDCP